MTAFDKNLISFAEAAKLLKKINVSSIHRWRKQGVNGVRLDAVRVGSKWFTTREAVEAFSGELTPKVSDSPQAATDLAPNPEVASPTPKQRSSASQKAVNESLVAVEKLVAKPWGQMSPISVRESVRVLRCALEKHFLGVNG